MHVHTDHLTADDMRSILRETIGPRGVIFDDERGELVSGRSRSRHHRHTFYLVATDGYGRRWANSGFRGASHRKAATYDEWGVFLAKLFERDEEAKAGSYNGRQDFERQTDRTVAMWLVPELLPDINGKVPTVQNPV